MRYFPLSLRAAAFRLRTALRVSAASLLGCIVLTLPLAASAHSATPDTAMWVADGDVYAIATVGTTAYLGGVFSVVGPSTGYGVPISRTTGIRATTFPEVNDVVHDVIPDGSGGWFIAGMFTKVGGLTRNHLAHILPNGSVDTSWNPNADNGVYALALSPDGTILYAGGSFTSIGGVSRNHLAALNTGTGTASSWNPSADGQIEDIVTLDGSVYVAGTFSNVGSAARYGIAELDATTGVATAWDAGSNGTCKRLAVSPDEDTLYIGGSFSLIGGDSRQYLAELDLS
ncbi:delta-60 repeat domain-containing protein, partial [Candidatus Uhrbacteria bacterium]|nr:delta-60 repeat domain-containing protein [Candidatus Uhrbacteria bacterium]